MLIFFTTFIGKVSIKYKQVHWNLLEKIDSMNRKAYSSTYLRYENIFEIII